MMDEHFGPVIFEGGGTFDGSSLSLTLRPTNPEPGAEGRTVTLKGALNQSGAITGNWVSDAGA
jgi:hypothetical protein